MVTALQVLLVAAALTLVACTDVPDTTAGGAGTGVTDVSGDRATRPGFGDRATTDVSPGDASTTPGETSGGGGDVGQTADGSLGEPDGAEGPYYAGPPGDGGGTLPDVFDVVRPEADLPTVEEDATDANATEDTAGAEDTAGVEDTSAADDTGLTDTTGPMLDVSEPPIDVPQAEVGPADTPEPEPDLPEPPQGPLWLLTIDNSGNDLLKVDVDTGATAFVCSINNSVSYPSLTFSRFNTLYASRGGTALDEIDPCTCAVTQIGPYVGYGGVNGITSDQGPGLFGVSSNQDELIQILTDTGLGVSVGALGVDFGTGGATWSDALGALYAINGTTDSLYEVNPSSGVATSIAGLDYDFGTVGIELHPANGVIYACSSAADLLRIDPAGGGVVNIGDMGLGGSCTNLAAPYLSIPCLESIVIP